MVPHYFSLQDIKISFEDVDFYAKLSLILNTPVRNSKTQRTILYNLVGAVFVYAAHFLSAYRTNTMTDIE